MNTRDIAPTLATLFSEVALGAPAGNAYVLNGGDPGLLAALDRLTTAEASRSNDGGATIAAHVEHLAYSIELVNRWADGETNPWATADWGAAWRTTAVDDARWAELRRSLRDEVTRWNESIAKPRDVQPIELNGVVASVVHFAYHMGAMRQIAAKVRGPKDGESAS